MQLAPWGLGIQSMLRDIGVDLPLEVVTDASAAKGIACRKGLNSKTRHIATHYLWIQERIANGDFTLSKCWGGENPGDLMTKYLSKDKIIQISQVLGFKFL